jgi:hypothetical protein
MTHGEKMIATARAELGTAEQPLGSNCGHAIRKYKAETWLDPDDCWPWCVAFYIWTVHAAFGKKFPRPTAGVADIADFARDNDLDVPVSQMKPGDAVCFGGQHISIYERGEGSFIGLGGNQGHAVSRSTYSRGNVTTVISADRVAHMLGLGPAKPKPPKQKPKPRYEIVRGEGDQEKVVAVVRGVAAVKAKVGQLLSKGAHGVRVRKRKRRAPTAG